MRLPAVRFGVLGSSGFLGGAVSKQLDQERAETAGTSLSAGVDLRDLAATREWFAENRPEIVLNCAAYVGGIQFGLDHPIELFDNNLQMTLNIYRCCAEFQVRRLVNPISNCIYPARATLFRESEVWDGPLDRSVLVYGMARKMHFIGSVAYGKQGRLDSINIVLPNMYGPGDHFDPVRSHALGGLIRKIVSAHRTGAPQVEVWGTGAPVREWLYIHDGARAMLAATVAGGTADLINVGTGVGYSILETARKIGEIAGYRGEFVCDPSRPDGAPHKTLDGTRGTTHLQWEPLVSFDDGLKRTIDWYLERHPA